MSQDLPALPPDLKPVPAEHEDAWQKIQQREPEPMQRALYLVMAEGLSPRRAGFEVGYSDGNANQLYYKARHYGVFRPQREQVLERQLAISITGADEILERLTRRPETIDDIALNAYTGTATDKVVKLGSTPTIDPHGSALEAALHHAVTHGGSFSLTVTGPPRDSDDHDRVPEHSLGCDTITIEPDPDPTP